MVLTKDLPPIYLCRVSNHAVPFRFTDSLRSQHFFAVGDISTKARELVYGTMLGQDILRRAGTTVVDFTGDVSERLLAEIPPSRVSETIYADFGDRKFIPGINFLPQVLPDSRQQLARQLTNLLKGIWGDAIQGRSDWVALNTIRAHLELPDAMLPGLTKIFINSAYREMVIKHIKDPFVQDFWETVYPTWTERYRIEAISPIENKFGQFINDPYIRNPLCATFRNLDFKDVIQNKRLLIVNLNSRQNGRKTAELLGSILLALFHAADQEIQPTGEANHHLYLTDIEKYPPDVITTLIDDSRNVSINMATTHTGRLDAKLTDTLLAQVGAIAAFNVNAVDAELLRRTFGFLEASAFVSWQPEDFYLRLPEYAKPITVSTLTESDHQKYDLRQRHGRNTSIIQNSRDKFLNTRGRIERSVSKWRKKWA